jgi:putative two-component system response regulator
VTKPDVIVLDIVMPEMDGFELLEKIVTNPDIADIPIVFITAKKESRGNLEPFGYFLAKPLDKDVFLLDIEKALQSKA